MPTPVVAVALTAVIGLGGMLVAACGGDDTKTASGTPSAAAVRKAIDATTHASGFVVSTPGVEVTYAGPDHVQQIEHGESSQTSSNGASTGPTPSTITKLFIDDQYYEGTSVGSAPATFEVRPRCDRPDNAADALLAILKVLKPGTPTPAGVPFTATYVTRGNTVPVSGQLRLKDGVVQSMSFGAGSVPARDWTFSSINHPPQVRAPAGATPSSGSC